MVIAFVDDRENVPNSILHDSDPFLVGYWMFYSLLKYLGNLETRVTKQNVAVWVSDDCKADNARNGRKSFIPFDEWTSEVYCNLLYLIFIVFNILFVH